VATVAIALGSNLGDRRAHLEFALTRLADHLSNLQASDFYDTDPVGVPGNQPPFLNGAAVGETLLSPKGLLDALQAIERARGRERPYKNAPRTLDLDLILYGDTIIDEKDLHVPHPRFRERRFVLEPLAAIAPELVDPVTGVTVRELLSRLAPRPV
jgi:2-amino-4-hydroxy-6-hydroxymethyldihydropteridine diphosphokinase